MKIRILAVTVLMGLIGVTSCKKHESGCHCAATYMGGAEVIKDCTGTYLRYQQKDYLVCNKNMLNAYGSGTWLNVGFNKTNNCQTLPETVCAMYHENEGTVNLVCVRPLIMSE